MDFNRACKLMLTDVYYYDISSCHYTILEKMNIDLSNVPKENKLERNTKIGLMMRDNPRLTSLLRKTTNSLIDEYLIKNDISEENLILRAYDGIITTKKLLYTDLYIPIGLQSSFDRLLISFDRQMYIGKEYSEVTIKGMPHRFDMMDKVLSRLIKLNFSNTKSVFMSLQKIKDEILSSDDPYLYCIPANKNSYIVFLKDYGETTISKTLAKVLDTNDIDKERYFDNYLRPFCQSIVIELA